MMTQSMMILKYESLELLCAEMNANLSSLAELINAITRGDIIVGVLPFKENGDEAGYKIFLKTGAVVTIYHGKNCQDAIAPVFGVKSDADDVYYWTLAGEFVVDAEGNKVPVAGSAGVTPQLKIENEKWYVTYDKGKDWEELGSAESETFASSIFADVEFTETVLTLTLADGETILFPIKNGFKVVLGEFDATALQYGSDLEIPYAVEGAMGEVVVFLLTEGDCFAVELVEETATSGKVTVRQLEETTTEKKLKLSVNAQGENGKVVSKSVKLVSGVLTTVEGNQDTYIVEPRGGKVEFYVATNTAFEVKVEERCDWITYVPRTKAVEEVALSFEVVANEGGDREATVLVVSGDVKLSFTVTQAGGFIVPEETLVGAYRIKKFWVYGGTGAEYGCAGWIDLHNMPWWFDEDSGHDITAELDNYLEFTLTGFNFNYTQSTGKCVNWAGIDGKNWSCFFHNSSINEGEPTDGSSFYRQIPIGESTWVRDYTVTPNTVTFTDAEGRKTVLELLEPGYEFTTDKYGDSNAAANTRTFPRSEEDDLTFHAKVKGSDNWNAAYTQIDMVYYNPRDFFIDVDRVDEIPAEAKTYEGPYDPESIYPKTLEGTYKYATDMTIGGPDGRITVKALTDQYATWEPAASKVNKIKNDVYTFVPTGTDHKQNEVGTVEFNDGGDGTWDYTLYDVMNGNKEYDGTELYGIIAHDGSTTYVYDRTSRTITFTTRGKEYVVDYLIPGDYAYDGAKVSVDQDKFPYTFGMHYDMGYTATRVEGYTTINGFARHYVWARHWNLYLLKQ